MRIWYTRCIGLLGLLFLSAALCAQDGLPHYCKTDVGVLGPYPNPGNVNVGDSCFGTKNGQQYNGVAVMSKSGNADNSGNDDGNNRPSKNSNSNGLPRYCKTDAGVLGPYPNPGNVHVGDACFGTKNGQRYDGVAVMSKSENDNN